MKSLLASILLIIYGLVSTGFVVSTHYCMGQVEGVQLGAVAEDTCSKCGMEKEDNAGCCRDEVKVVKLQQDLQPAKAVLHSFSVQQVINAAPGFSTTPFHDFREYQRTGASDTSPPMALSGIYIMHCVFRI